MSCCGYLSHSELFSMSGWICMSGATASPLLSVVAAVCFYRQLQTLHLWTSVIPGQKSPTPPVTAVVDEATVPQNQTRHAVFCFPSAATGPQSAPSSLFLQGLFCCLRVQHDGTLASGQYSIVFQLLQTNLNHQLGFPLQQFCLFNDMTWNVVMTKFSGQCNGTVLLPGSTNRGH